MTMKERNVIYKREHKKLLNPSKISLVIISVMLILISLSLVSAVTCNGTEANGYHLSDGRWLINSTSITDGCIISSTGSFVLSGETFYMNGTTTGGLINFYANNSIFDGNYSWIVGNNSVSYRGIWINGANNNFTNLNISNYYFNILIQRQNNIIQNSYTSYANYSGIEWDARSNNTLVNNVSFISNKRAIEMYNTQDNLVINCSFFNSTTNSISLTTNANNNTFSYNLFNKVEYAFSVGAGGYNNKFVYNNISNSADTFQISGIGDNISYNRFVNITGINSHVVAAINITIGYNYFYNQTTYQMLYFTKGSKNINVIGNIFDLNSKCIAIENSTNIYFANNICNRSILNYDVWNVGVYLQDDRAKTNTPSNITFYNNTFENYGSVGIYARGFYNLTLINNTFNQGTDAYYSSNRVGSSYEPISAIFISEVIKGFVPTGTLLGDGYAQTSIHNSTLVTLSGNVFNSNVRVPLRTQGVNQLIHDLSNYYFKSWQLPYLLDRDDFYISNNFNNISTITNSGAYSEILKQGINGNFSLNYSIYKNYFYFKATNNSPFQVYVFNLTSALLTNGTSLCNGSSSNLALNTGNVNITLSPGEECWVYDNYCQGSDEYWDIPSLTCVKKAPLCMKLEDTYTISIAFLGLIVLVSMVMIVVRITQGHPFDNFIQHLFYIILVSVIPLILGVLVINAMFVGCH